MECDERFSFRAADNTFGPANNQLWSKGGNLLSLQNSSLLFRNGRLLPGNTGLPDQDAERQGGKNDRSIGNTPALLAAFFGLFCWGIGPMLAFLPCV